MRLGLVAMVACGCVSTPDNPPPPCSLRILDELTSIGGTFESPWLSPDHLRIYEASRNATDVIAYATRGNADDTFSLPVPRADLALQNGDMPRRVTLSPDELEIWIFTDSGNLYYASRAHASEPFPLPAVIVKGPTSVTFTSDMLLAYYTRGDGVLRISTRASRSAAFDFGTETTLLGFPDPTSEQVDSCGSDLTGATLYCAIKSTADPNNTLRIWQATSSSPMTQPYELTLFTAIDAQPEADDYDPMLDADGRTLVFASRRDPAPTTDAANPWLYCD